MATLRTPRLNGRRRVATVTQVVTPPPSGGSAPPALSDIVWNQPYPVNPNAWDGSIVGWCDPVGGIGPYVWTSNIPGYRFISKSDSNVRIWFYAPGPDPETYNFTCTDARGDTVTKAITITKSVAGVPTFVCNSRNPINNARSGIGTDVFNNAIFYPCVSGGTFSANTNPTVTPSTVWSWQYTRLRATTTSMPAVGNYPLTLSAIDSAGHTATLNFTAKVVAYTPITYIEFNQSIPVTTSTSGNTPIGQACATTPNNLPTWTINDNGKNILIVNGTTGQVTLTQKPTIGGNYPFTLTVTDQTATYSQVFSLFVAVGITLQDTSISFTPNVMTNAPINNAPVNGQTIGTPSSTVTGFPANSIITWRVTKCQRWNFDMDNPLSITNNVYDARGGVGKPRFTADPSTGKVTAWAQLSDTTGTAGEWFDLTATENTGIYTCTKRVYVTVNPMPSIVYHVGVGMSNSSTRISAATAAGLPTGVGGFEHLRDFLALPGVTEWKGGTNPYAGSVVYIYYNSDETYYVEDWLTNYELAKRGINGPLKFIGIPGPSGELPYIGGRKGSSKLLVSVGGKSLFDCNDGDFTFKNLHLAFCRMGVFGGDYVPGSNNTTSLIRQESGMSGDITIDNCDLHDADVPLEAGNSDGKWKITNLRIYNGAACTSTAGANQHNAYIGHVWRIEVDNILSQGSSSGHVFKCRATEGTWNNCRFYDGERGRGFNALQLAVGGTHTITNCEFQKSPMSMNSFIMQYADEIPGYMNEEILKTQDYVHILTMNNCKFMRHSPDVIGDTGLNINGVIGPNTGVPTLVNISNTSFEGIQSAKTYRLFSNLSPGYDFTPRITLTNVTYPTTFSALNFTSPVSYNPGRPGWHDATGWLNQSSDMPYYNARQIDPGSDDIRISASAAPGTVIFTPTAYGAPNYSLSPNTQPDPNINPFTSGTVWSHGQTTGFHTGFSFNYANAGSQNRYTIDPTTGAFKVGSAGLGGTGCDKVLIRATGPTGRIVENAFYINKF